MKLRGRRRSSSASITRGRSPSGYDDCSDDDDDEDDCTSFGSRLTRLPEVIADAPATIRALYLQVD